MRYKIVLVLALMMVSSGCATHRSVLEGLNEREIQSCVWFMGSVGPWANIRVVSATGGEDLSKCMNH